MNAFDETAPPAITGKLQYPGLPFVWRIVTDENGLAIVGNRNQVRRSGWAIVVVSLLAAIGFCFVFFRYFGFAPTVPRVAGLILLVMLPIAIGIVILNWVAKDDEQRGPRLVYKRKEDVIELPREGLVIPRGRVLRWNLVRGPWRTGEGWKVEMVVSELQLVFEEDGKTRVIPLIGVSGARAINDAARQIADVTGVELRELVGK